MEAWIPRLFLIGAVLAAVGCLERADYNFPVFLFGYMAWTHMKNQKLTVTLLFCFSIFMDFIWFYVVALRTWFHQEYKKLLPLEHGIHVTVTSIVFVNLILKISCVVLTFFFEPKIKQSF